MITLTNDFHNSEAHVRPNSLGRINPAQARRVARKLCGFKDCTCGSDILNRHGQQPTGSPKRIEAMYHAATGKLVYVEFPALT